MINGRNMFENGGMFRREVSKISTCPWLRHYEGTHTRHYFHEYIVLFYLRCGNSLCI